MLEPVYAPLVKLKLYRRRGRKNTWRTEVELTGRGSLNMVLYDSFNTGTSLMSVTKMRTFRTLSKLDPAASSTASRLFKH
jgi:hypothetical protein